MGDYRAMFRVYDRIKEVTAEDVMDFANKYFVEKNRTVAYRVKIEKEKKEGEEDSLEEIDQQVLMQYLMSLGQEEAMAIQQKLMSMKSEQEAMEYARELWERAKAAGFAKDNKKEE
jgi:hypothetical protein